VPDWIEERNAIRDPFRSGTGLDDWLDADVDLIITNPPWDRDLLHPMIHQFRQLRPTWLLFDADWAFTEQATFAELFLQYCAKIVVVGRVKWIEGSEGKGKENCAWYLFTSEKAPAGTPLFYGMGHHG
ncbi:MAG: hypothetical protein AAFY03_05025, partial [Pseudomonadota bacterium]